VLRLRRKSGPSSISLADRAREAGRWEVATEHYRAALTRNPHNAPIWLQYGHALKESGNRTAAEAAYRRAIEDDPGSAEVYLQLGHVLKLQDRIEEAGAAYRRAWSLAPSLQAAGDELAALGASPEHAAPLPTDSNAADVARKPAKPSIISRADRARELRDWATAARLYRRALARNPDRAPIWVQYGHALKESGRLGEAEGAYRQALVWDPHLADGYRQLGSILKLRGRPEEAQAAYLRAFALDPSLFSELHALGWSETQVAELRYTVDGGRSEVAGAPNGVPDSPAPTVQFEQTVPAMSIPAPAMSFTVAAAPRYATRLRGDKPRLAFICEPQYFKVHFWNDLDDLFDVALFPMQFRRDLEFFRPVVDFDADYNVFFRGEFLPPGLLDRLRGRKINWSSEPFPKVVDGRLHATLDSLNRLEAFLGIEAHPFDHVFHYDEASASLLRRIGCRLSGFPALPIATESLRRDSPLATRFPSVNGEFDIFFVGRSTPYRERFFTPLKHSLNFLHIESGVFGADLLPFVRNSKIVVNVHAEDFLGWEPRVQQFLASECFVVSEPISPNPHLVPGEHFVEASTPEAFAETCRHFLGADEEREAIARAGSRRVREVLAANQVFPALLEQIERGTLPTPAFHIDAAALKALSYFAKFNEFGHVEEFFTSFGELVD
jgi:tetratricopeptide (TPR) repeat protein